MRWDESWKTRRCWGFNKMPVPEIAPLCANLFWLHFNKITKLVKTKVMVLIVSGI